jgi:hypothetical protein
VWNGTNFEAAGSGGGANDTIPANAFSARVDENGNIVSTSHNFIQSITKDGTGQYTVNLIPGFFTEQPAIVVTSVENNNEETQVVRFQTLNSFRVFVARSDFDNTFSNSGFHMVLFRQGADYQNTLTAPPNVVGYLQTNGNDFYLDTASLNIGAATSNPNADLTLSSTDKGLQLNKVDTADIFASLGAADQGLIVFDTIENQLFVWNGNNFEATGSGGGANDTIPSNVFTALINAQSGTATLISESYPFIDNVTRTGVGRVVVDFIPGFFSEIPAAGATVLDRDGRTANISLQTTNSLRVNMVDAGAGGDEDNNFMLIVQRQGADYQNTLTAPPNIVSYLQSNGTKLYTDTADLVIGSNVNNPNEFVV